MPRFATLTDFDDEGIPRAAFGATVSLQLIQRVLDKTSAYVAGYVAAKLTTPLLPPYDPAIVTAVVQLSAWKLIVRRGFSPEDPGDKAIRQGWLDAKEWLNDVANGKIKLDQKQSFPDSLQPSVDTNVRRGYGERFEGDATDNPFVGGPGNWGG